MTPGQTFSPLAPPTLGAPNNRPGEGASPVQDAIRLLSFRMPSVVGAGAPSPQGLMGGQTALGAQLGTSIAEQWLRSLFSGGGMNGGLPDLGGGGGMPGGMPGGMGLPNQGQRPSPQGTLPNIQFGTQPPPPVQPPQEVPQDANRYRDWTRGEGALSGGWPSVPTGSPRFQGFGG